MQNTITDTINGVIDHIANIAIDDDAPLPPGHPSRPPATLAASAAPHLRKLFDLINESPGQSRACRYHVPHELRDYVADYLGDRGYAVRYCKGQCTGQSFAVVAPKGE